jgi:hypothetical protein
MPSAAAATIGNGWGFWAEHAGSANQLVLTSVSSQTFTDGFTNYGEKFVLTASGEGVRITSDGGNWVVSQHTPPAIKAGSTILTIADRLAAAPGSPPAQGAMYIATGAATWGSTSVANHDVVMHTTGGAYVKFTPPTDCGWVAFVQDEDEEYQFQGSAWVQKINRAATQASKRPEQVASCRRGPRAFNTFTHPRRSVGQLLPIAAAPRRWPRLTISRASQTRALAS